MVESGGAGLHGAAALEQEQAQVLAPTAPAGKAQALAGEQAARGEGGVNQIALAPPALLAARALALVDRDAGLLEEAYQSGVVPHISTQAPGLAGGSRS